MDRSRFFAALRSRGSVVFGTSLSQKQVAGIEAILDEAERRGTLRAHLAYMLATAYHETAHTMQPIEEYGRGKGRKYGKPTGPDGQVYFGRGFVQLTWIFNYDKAGKKLNIDLVKYPERALELRIATAIMFDGMAEGWFTGKKLSDFEDNPYNFRSARKIINGMDRADAIAGYAKAFESALIAGDYTRQKPKPLETVKPVPAPAPAPTPQPSPAPTPVAKRSLLATIFAAILSLFKKGN